LMAGVLLPPVVARLGPERDQMPDAKLDRVGVSGEGPLVARGVLAEGPQPGAVAVELEVPPFLGCLIPLEGVAAMQKCVGRDRLALSPRLDLRDDRVGAVGEDASAPVEETLGTFDPPCSAHRVGDEGAVAEPAVAVDRERR